LAGFTTTNAPRRAPFRPAVTDRRKRLNHEEHEEHEEERDKGNNSEERTLRQDPAKE
jgi:hypothetical protein